MFGGRKTEDLRDYARVVSPGLIKEILSNNGQNPSEKDIADALVLTVENLRNNISGFFPTIKDQVTLQVVEQMIKKLKPGLAQYSLLDAEEIIEAYIQAYIDHCLKSRAPSDVSLSDEEAEVYKNLPLNFYKFCLVIQGAGNILEKRKDFYINLFKKLNLFSDTPEFPAILKLNQDPATRINRPYIFNTHFFENYFNDKVKAIYHYPYYGSAELPKWLYAAEKKSMPADTECEKLTSTEQGLEVKGPAPADPRADVPPEKTAETSDEKQKEESKEESKEGPKAGPPKARPSEEEKRQAAPALVKEEQVPEQQPASIDRKKFNEIVSRYKSRHFIYRLFDVLGSGTMRELKKLGGHPVVLVSFEDKKPLDQQLKALSDQYHNVPLLYQYRSSGQTFIKLYHPTQKISIEAEGPLKRLAQKKLNFSMSSRLSHSVEFPAEVASFIHQHCDKGDSIAKETIESIIKGAEADGFHRFRLFTETEEEKPNGSQTDATVIELRKEFRSGRP